MSNNKKCGDCKYVWIMVIVASATGLNNSLRFFFGGIEIFVVCFYWLPRYFRWLMSLSRKRDWMVLNENLFQHSLSWWIQVEFWISINRVFRLMKIHLCSTISKFPSHSRDFHYTVRKRLTFTAFIDTLPAQEVCVLLLLYLINITIAQ